MHTQSHRHFVAVPLMCLLLVLIAGVNAVLPVKGAVLPGQPTINGGTLITAGDVRRSIDIDWHLQGMLEPKSRILLTDSSHATFVAGEAILSSHGYFTLSLDKDRSLTLLAATVWIRRDGTDISIVALDAPVLVDLKGSRTMIPAGFQFRITSTSKLSPAPSDWLSERIADASSLMQYDVVLDPAASFAEQVEARLAEAFQSEAALDPDESSSLIALGDTIDPSGILSGLIAYRLGLHPGRLSEDSQTKVEASFRSSPVAETAFSAIPSIVQFTLKPVSVWLIDGWSSQVIRQGMDDPQAGMAVVRDNRDLPSRLKEIGYPLQSDAWQSALDRIEQTLLPLLTPDEQESIFGSSGSSQAQSSVSSSVAAPQYTEQQLLAITRQMLVDHGALMGSETHLLPLAGPPQAVRVIGVFVLEDGRDVAYEFTFDPAANVLSRIVRDGIAQPNAVPVEVMFQ